MRWWRWIRNFFRRQYTAESRAEIRERHSVIGKRSGVSANEFAAVPVLNSQQLVARWKLDLPPKYVSESSDLPMDSLSSGVYVLEATNGTYRAYTVIVVSEMALVTKTSRGHILAYTADRETGTPISDTVVTTWKSKKQAAQFKTDNQGMGEARVGSEDKSSEDGGGYSDYGSQWVLAQHEKDVALVAPYSLNLSSDPNQDWTGYVYTDRSVYRPGDTVYFKAIVRKQDGDRLLLPSDREIQVKIEDSARNVILQKTYSLSPFGSLNGSLELPATATLGYCSITVNKGYISGSFQVEEYKKPEYFVKVTPDAPRVLQGGSVKATIEARYYFGEPVANAKVKYVVHTQRSYYFSNDDGEESDPTTANEGGGDEGAPGDSRFFYGDQILEKEGKLDANGKLVVNIPTRVEDKYKIDTEYRIEARITDDAGREIAGHNAFLATYGSFHLEVNAQSYIYKQGDSAEFTVKAMDYDKHPVSTAVHLEIVRTRYGAKDEVIQSSDGNTGTDGLAHFTLPLAQAGFTTVRVTAMSGSRQVSGASWLWIAGKDEQTWAEGQVRNLQLVADKASYKVGDTAHILINGAAPNTTLLLTTEGSSVLSKQLVRAGDTSTTVDVPITIESQPNIYV